jgi:uncharacterized FlgJ-related protein
LNKKRIFFDIEKAVLEAKKLAIENEKTFCIYKEGKAISYTDAATAIIKGYDIIQYVSGFN